MQSEMEMLLQIGGVVVPCVSAFAGLFAWGLRRMDRRFDEAATERKRIEMQLSERCDRIEERCDRIETQLGERCDRIEERCDRIEERCDRIEREFKERCDRIDERIDRMTGQLSDQVLSLSMELGKAQGAARAAVEAAPG